MEAIFGSAEEEKKPHRHHAGKNTIFKQLSPMAYSVVERCAEMMSIADVADLWKQFEKQTPDSARICNIQGDYARNFVEFCCFRVLSASYRSVNLLSDRCFSRLTFDMMVAWESPCATSNNSEEINDPIAKEEHERQLETEAKEEEDEASLFYSDLMPLLVEVECSVGVDAFTRLAPAMPVVADVVNAQFQFETLTSATGGRLPFPTYERYLKQLNKNINSVKTTPSSLNLEKGEIVLHVDGAGATRVVRHIGATSRPGRLTLTNHALYFETPGLISYEKAIKFDLSTDAQHQVKAGSTGPWGAPLFDKAVIYECNHLEEPLVLEFPELTGSTRRDYWLALIKEVISVHEFARMFELEGLDRAEALSRSVLGVVRLHATRETFQIFPMRPQTLLTFSWPEELPGGDYVLQELANSIRTGSQKENIDAYICSAASVLDSVFGVMDREFMSVGEAPVGELSPLQAVVQRSTIEAKKTEIARATVEGLRAEGIGDNAAILKELLIGPFMNITQWFRRLLSWEKPLTTLLVFILSLMIAYMEWVVGAMSASLALAAGILIWIRRRTDIKDKYNEIVISARIEQSAMEGVVSGQQALNRVNSAIQTANITLLKLLSIVLSKPIKHTDQVILALLSISLALLIIPFKVIVMGVIVDVFTMNLRIRNTRSSERTARRMKEWWDGVPAISVRLTK